MDDAAIEKIRREVLGRLSGTPEERVVSSLESRVAALETALREMRDAVSPAAGSADAAPRGHAHPSLVLLSVPAGADSRAGDSGRCILEPDKPCVHSGACRTFGH